jgi:hypothetical protein
MLRATGDGAIATSLTSRLDLPDTAPYGVEWSPFLRGFPLGQHYVLARTILDEHALRTGMVFTHALIAPLDEMARFDNLRNLIDLLCEVPCPEKVLNALDVQSESPVTSAGSSEQIAVAILLASRRSGPVVRLGHRGFDQVIAELWSTLWPRIRLGFAFRLSFGPSDLVESPVPSIVCTPQNVSARWVGYKIVDLKPAQKPLSPAAALLIGAPEGSKLFEYASSLGVEIGTFGDLILLESAYALQRTAAGSFDNTIGLLRLVETLASGQSNATPGKEEVVANVRGVLPTATAAQVLSLRNIKLSSVNQPERIWNGLREWMAKYAFPSTEDSEIARLLGDLDGAGNAVREWQNAIVDGLNTVKSSPTSQFAKAFWRWGLRSPDVYKHVFQCISLQEEDEPFLIEAAPNQIANDAAVHNLLSLSASRRLYRLHAVIASMVFPPKEAVRVQLDVQKEVVSPVGLQLALRNAQPTEVVECALAFHNSQLTELAGSAASLQPSLLVDIDMNDETAQDVWRDALRKNQACWNGPKRPHETFHIILNTMLDRRGVETPLINALADTPLADLSGYSRRKELWSFLSGNTKDRLIAATAAGWLNRVAGGGVTPLESEVQLHIVNSPMFVISMRRFLSLGVDAALRLISLLSLLDEARFLDLLPMLTSTALTPSEADVLGKLLRARQWSQAARGLATLLGQGREDIRPALRACHDLLSLWTRFTLGVPSLSAEEKWHALEQVVTDLYPSGPDHDDLWRRAGGSNADLQHTGNGRSRWSDALRKVRAGYGLRVSNLVREMKTDFPLNDDLQSIGADPEFREKR